jgi:hypothetical protein
MDTFAVKELRIYQQDDDNDMFWVDMNYYSKKELEE